MSNQCVNGEHLHEGSRYPSPFGKVLALGWYDGPTNGLVECHQGGQVYKFDLLDEIRQWPTEADDLRIFSLAPLPPGSLRQLIDAYARYHQPHWPLWAPSWSFPAAADREAMDRVTEEVLQKAGRTTWVFASRDLLVEIIVARAVTPEEVAQVEDWPAFLGVGKDAALNS